MSTETIRPDNSALHPRTDTGIPIPPPSPIEPALPSFASSLTDSHTDEAYITTLKTLHSLSPSLRALPRTGVLIPSATTTPPTDPYLPLLAGAARTLADSVLAPSVLVGRTSESDEGADVPVFIGQVEDGEGEKVVERLEVKGGKISDFAPLPSSSLPRNLVALSPPSSPELKTFKTLLSELQSAFEFTIEPSTSSSTVLYGLLGKRQGAWQGLLSTAVQS